MNTSLKFLILLTLGGGLSGPVDGLAQQANPPSPGTPTRIARPVSDSEELKVSKPPAATSSPGTNFEERLAAIMRKANNQPLDQEKPEKALDNNYQIKVEYLTEGKPGSISIVTANAKFSYDGIMKETTVDGIVVPATIAFEGQLSKETDSSIFLAFFLGRSVPYSANAHYGSKGAGVYTSIQQLQVGTRNGATFQLGKPLKVVESDGETITITISKVRNP
jgi:hypothetical protein